MPIAATNFKTSLLPDIYPAADLPSEFCREKLKGEISHLFRVGRDLGPSGSSSLLEPVHLLESLLPNLESGNSAEKTKSLLSSLCAAGQVSIKRPC